MAKAVNMRVSRAGIGIAAGVIVAAATLGAVAIFHISRSHRATTPPSFVGTWHVHDSELQIMSRLRGIETDYNIGPCVHASAATCSETNALSLSVSSDRSILTATITKIGYTANGALVAAPQPTESRSVGDSVRLEFVEPQLLKETIIRSSLPMVDQVAGNPYWCGDHLAAQLQQYCGA
jgi:hypothetical protein